MAKTEAAQKSYILEVTFTVDFTADEHLQTVDGIRNEVRSWLESLDAEVKTIVVREARDETSRGAPTR